MNIVLAIVAFLVVLGPLVLIHEFGHFIALRLVGVTVLEFGFGFPPRARKLFEWRGTEFTLNWLPIGGFVRPLGEDFVKPLDDNSTAEERAAFEKHQADLAALGEKAVKTKSVSEATPLQRIFYLSAGAAMNFLGAFVILIITAMLGQPAPAVGVRAVAPTSPAAAQGIKYLDVIDSINGQVISTADQATQVLSKITSQPVNLVLNRDGKSINVTLNPTDHPLRLQGIWIDSIVTGSPADKAGLKPNDIILKADTTNVSSTDGLKKYIETKLDQPIQLSIERDGQPQTITITPSSTRSADQGRLGVGIEPMAYNPTFGISAADVTGAVRKYSLFEAVPIAGQRTVDTIGQTVSAPVKIITGQLKGSGGRVLSPVGIAQVSSEVVSRSVDDRTPYLLLGFIAAISIALGVTNLLPIPGLDGGRILFVLVEIIRGKPMAPEREGMVHLIGLVLLLGLMAVLVVNDLFNPIGPILPK